MIVFQGVLMVSPAPHAARASLSCGFQGVSSVTAPTARASSFGFQMPCDSTMRRRTGTSAGALLTKGPRAGVRDVPADVPTFRASQRASAVAGWGRADEPVVPRRGNHGPRAVPHYPFGMLRHGQPMKGLPLK